jgi:hypothetical protein
MEFKELVSERSHHVRRIKKWIIGVKCGLNSSGFSSSCFSFCINLVYIPVLSIGANEIVYY